MPKYRMYVLKDAEDTNSEGGHETWNLPWERLVFDQRIEHRSVLWKITGMRQTPDGVVYEVAPDPGLRNGGDPKKDRAPWGTGRRS